jgi:hypothetical protein
VDHRASQDNVKKRKFLTLPGLELPLLRRPARSQKENKEYTNYIPSYPKGTGGSFSGVYSDRGVKLTTLLQMVSRSRIRGTTHPLLHS